MAGKMSLQVKRERVPGWALVPLSAHEVNSCSFAGFTSPLQVAFASVPKMMIKQCVLSGASKCVACSWFPAERHPKEDHSVGSQLFGQSLEKAFHGQ